MMRYEASAPGRVNLLGEHTDYNDGWVLPMAIPQRTRVTLTPETGPWVRAHTADTAPGEARYELGHEAPTGTWIDYVQGLTQQVGDSVRGFALEVDSDVPVGSGLSSSAALEIAVLRALREAFSLPYDELGLARLAHRAEVEFVGVPVGMLDQMACTFADDEHALFLDIRSLDFERVQLPVDAGLVVLDSGQHHRHGSGEYRARRAECAQAARLLGVPALRDIDGGEDRLGELPDVLQRRVRHVVSENARVRAAVDVMRSGDTPALGRLFDVSHASMRDDFECTTAEIDHWVDRVRQLPGVHGARLTGGGFGGAIVVLADRGATHDTARAATALAFDIPGLTAHALVPPA